MSISKMQSHFLSQSHFELSKMNMYIMIFLLFPPSNLRVPFTGFSNDKSNQILLVFSYFQESNTSDAMDENLTLGCNVNMSMGARSSFPIGEIPLLVDGYD
jgi:hypothetical protein